MILQGDFTLPGPRCQTQFFDTMLPPWTLLLLPHKILQQLLPLVHHQPQIPLVHLIPLSPPPLQRVRQRAYLDRQNRDLYLTATRIRPTTLLHTDLVREAQVLICLMPPKLGHAAGLVGARAVGGAAIRQVRDSSNSRLGCSGFGYVTLDGGFLVACDDFVKCFAHDGGREFARAGDGTVEFSVGEEVFEW